MTATGDAAFTEGNVPDVKVITQFVSDVAWRVKPLNVATPLVMVAVEPAEFTEQPGLDVDAVTVPVAVLSTTLLASSTETTGC
ncbi:MAG: hypothetical protein KGJ39_07520 [Acidobacteriota bacterium]|nr:hypothetical protein [Acidobacteriota bacterium]